MTDKAYKTLLKELKKEAQKAKHNSKEEAIATLHRIGICTKTGKLKKPYRTAK
ncbi:hypothetical protein SMSP2_02664 [Limihaloglobus sulfuriphilus]|uniref:Uncharacterized protein n=1 Tax=Limihaloglobus sulfuriphilus TaxID=1851148 RepID=A0A1Q2MHW4_9BACT|nr:hypothetical protein [Limihaloglobus sulfuriphilus]AQQ72281.1 hypothetical protein SMSP2_02664 [Limihaloglobus sulfuriphilus]